MKEEKNMTGEDGLQCVKIQDTVPLVINANDKVESINAEIAGDVGKSGKLISELQGIHNDVSKHPQTP